MKYKSEVISKITPGRSQIMHSDMSDKAKANNKIRITLKTVFGVAEKYPKLKANKNFIQLQNRISSIESEISQIRFFYNETVNNYNI